MSFDPNYKRWKAAQNGTPQGASELKAMLDAALVREQESLRMVQNCILAGKHHAHHDNTKFWNNAETWLAERLGI